MKVHEQSLLCQVVGLEAKVNKKEVEALVMDVSNSMLTKCLTGLWQDVLTIRHLRNPSTVSSQREQYAHQQAIKDGLWDLKIDKSRQFVGLYVEEVLRVAGDIDWTSKENVQIDVDVFLTVERSAQVCCVVLCCGCTVAI